MNARMKLSTIQTKQAQKSATPTPFTAVYLHSSPAAKYVYTECGAPADKALGGVPATPRTLSHLPAASSVPILYRATGWLPCSSIVSDAAAGMWGSNVDGTAIAVACASLLR
ncbi:hypothetical protein Vretifemale_13806 [Volvox reticuliferus]|uniref:Uncharacterized protein n=1 Tax=Volvox reticuliferus TaxID=1737510 RepID=A0A8J4FTH7_9CHLO|nr:hypothetical protein Vretifemale_13806 [Volvox reticuliferus]